MGLMNYGDAISDDMDHTSSASAQNQPVLHTEPPIPTSHPFRQDPFLVDRLIISGLDIGTSYTIICEHNLGDYPAMEVFVRDIRLYLQYMHYDTQPAGERLHFRVVLDCLHDYPDRGVSEYAITVECLGEE